MHNRLVGVATAVQIIIASALYLTEMVYREIEEFRQDASNTAWTLSLLAVASQFDFCTCVAILFYQNWLKLELIYYNNVSVIFLCQIG